MSLVVKIFKALLYALLLFGGFAIYLVRKKTPGPAYRSMVKLFCLTNGRSNDWMSHLIGSLESRYRFPDANGVLGAMSNSSRLDGVVDSLRDRGYYQFENRLPEDVCDRLLQFAMSQPCEAYQMDGETPSKSETVVYPRANPRAVRYELRTQDLLANPDIQKLMADLSFAAVAQQYLDARPTIDVLSMWWLTAYSSRPDSVAAQFFHFDMDRPKWLKFFIYLTDVQPTNGPHTFVAGSHRSGILPERFLKKGYARLTDEEVGKAFPQQDIVEFSGPRGSILAEDTRGLHKGRHVEHDDRLMLQIQFSNSLFGADYQKTSFKGAPVSDLQTCIDKYPQIYSAYL